MKTDAEQFQVTIFSYFLCLQRDCLCLYFQFIKSNKTTPVLQCHGDLDPTVKYDKGVATAGLIESFNAENHEFKTFHGLGHATCPEVSCYVVCVMFPGNSSL